MWGRERGGSPEEYGRRERKEQEHASFVGRNGGNYTIILNILNQERNKGRRKVRKPKMQGMRGTFF